MTQQSPPKTDLKAMGIFLTVAFWGLIGVILLLRVAKTLVTTGSVALEGVGLAVSLVTVLGALGGDTPRRAVGKLWLIVGVLGLLALILGAGLDIKWMFDNSIVMIFIGFMTARLIFMDNK